MAPAATSIAEQPASVPVDCQPERALLDAQRAGKGVDAAEDERSQAGLRHADAGIADNRGVHRGGLSGVGHFDGVGAWAAAAAVGQGKFRGRIARRNRVAVGGEGEASGGHRGCLLRW